MWRGGWVVGVVWYDRGDGGVGLGGVEWGGCGMMVVEVVAT